MLVIDASVAVAACHTPMGFAGLRKQELVAPPLMIVEASSVLHEMAWRNDVGAERAETMPERLLSAPIETRSPSDLSRAAWRVANELGWAKTYDARTTSHSPRCSTVAWSASMSAYYVESPGSISRRASETCRSDRWREACCSRTASSIASSSPHALGGGATFSQNRWLNGAKFALLRTGRNLWAILGSNQ